MRTNRLAAALTLAALSGCATADPLREPGPVVFSAMGCGPYTPDAERALERYVESEGVDPRVDFLIHLGDVISGKFGRSAAALPDLGEGQYAKVSGWLGQVERIPILAVPGDNEWVDREDPEIGWHLWRKHFFVRERERGFARILIRQEGRPENFAFVLKGVLFVGINNVTGPAKLPAEEWSACLRDGASWLTTCFGRSGEARAAVVFAQSKPSPPLLKALQESAARFDGPILYIQADQHKWAVSAGTLAPNVLHVVTDKITSTTPAVHVTVTEDPERPFLFDRALGK